MIKKDEQRLTIHFTIKCEIHFNRLTLGCNEAKKKQAGKN